MAPQSSMNKEQDALLEQYRERYMSIHAGNKKYTQFWAMIRQQWFQQWPAIETLYPGRDSKSLNPLEVETVRRYIKSQMATIVNWYRWRANINNRTGARAPKLETILREALTETTIIDRNLCDWQMYSVHHYEERVKPAVDAELALLSVQNNGEPVTRSVRMQVVVRLIKEAFMKEDTDTKQKVYDLVAEQQQKKVAAKMAAKEGIDIDGSGSGKTEEPVNAKPDFRTTQRAVNSIPTILDDTFNWVHKNTGYYISAVFVGKDPRNGKPVTGSFHYGKNQFGFDFGTAYKDFHKAVMVPYTQFVQGLMDIEDKKTEEAQCPDTMGNTPSTLLTTPPVDSHAPLSSSSAKQQSLAATPSNTTQPMDPFLPSSAMNAPSQSVEISDTGKGKGVADEYRYHPNPATLKVLSTNALFTFEGDTFAQGPPFLMGSGPSGYLWDQDQTEDEHSSTYAGSDRGASDVDSFYDSEGNFSDQSSLDIDLSASTNFLSLHIHSQPHIDHSLNHSSSSNTLNTNPVIGTPLRFTTEQENEQRFQPPPNIPSISTSPPVVPAVPSEATSLPLVANDLFAKLDAVTIDILAPVNSSVVKTALGTSIAPDQARSQEASSYSNKTDPPPADASPSKPATLLDPSKSLNYHPVTNAPSIQIPNADATPINPVTNTTLPPSLPIPTTNATPVVSAPSVPPSLPIPTTNATPVVSAPSVPPSLPIPTTNATPVVSAPSVPPSLPIPTTNATPVVSAPSVPPSLSIPNANATQTTVNAHGPSVVQQNPQTGEVAEQHWADNGGCQVKPIGGLRVDSSIDTLPAEPTEQHNGNGGLADTTRRSSRPLVPSKRVEELNLIGTNTRNSKQAPATSSLATPPNWIPELKAKLLEYEGGEEWLKCVERWVEFEEGAHYTTAKGYLPSTDIRPSEWSTWTSGGRRHDRTPLIDEPSDFGIALTKWWHAMQPAFRRNEGLMPTTVFADLTGEHAECWAPIRKGGPNGFSTILIMVLWWGRALLSTSVWQDNSSSAWRDLVTDVASVLDAINFQAVNLKGVKRKGVDGNAGKRSKRGRG